MADEYDPYQLVRNHVSRFNVSNVERAFRSISLKNQPFEMKLRLEKRPISYDFFVEFHVPDRDTGEMVFQSFATSIPDWQAERMEEKEALHFFYYWIRSVFLHELDEAFHVDGVRVNDPHKNDAASRGRR